MGREIDGTRFEPRDFKRFAAALESETQLLEGWLAAARFDDSESKSVTSCCTAAQWRFALRAR